MSVNIVLFVGGANRDKQRNVAIQAIERTLMEDRTLNGMANDCALTNIETITVSEGAPYASCRAIFTIEYCYNLTTEE